MSFQDFGKKGSGRPSASRSGTATGYGAPSASSQGNASNRDDYSSVSQSINQYQVSDFIAIAIAIAIAL